MHFFELFVLSLCVTLPLTKYHIINEVKPRTKKEHKHCSHIEAAINGFPLIQGLIRLNLRVHYNCNLSQLLRPCIQLYLSVFYGEKRRNDVSAF